MAPLIARHRTVQNNSPNLNILRASAIIQLLRRAGHRGHGLCDAALSLKPTQKAAVSYLGNGSLTGVADELSPVGMRRPFSFVNVQCTKPVNVYRNMAANDEIPWRTDFKMSEVVYRINVFAARPRPTLMMICIILHTWSFGSCAFRFDGHMNYFNSPY